MSQAKKEKIDALYFAINAHDFLSEVREMTIQKSEKCLEGLYQRYLKLLIESKTEKDLVHSLKMLEKINRKLYEMNAQKK